MSGTRIVSLVLGAWLFISAFLWHHSSAQFANAWIMGALVVLFSFMANRFAQARYATAGIGAWLFVSSFFLPRATTATSWNHVLVGLALIMTSLMSEAPALRRRTATGGVRAR
jgi:hypothetical protein